MDELSFTLSSPITEEQWDMISDVDLDNTNEITFHTKHGKEVKFVKAQPERKKGKWISKPHVYGAVYCSECDYELRMNNTNYCPHCGLKMEVDE